VKGEWCVKFFVSRRALIDGGIRAAEGLFQISVFNSAFDIFGSTDH